jgi:putative ABC transport system permease protein
MLTFRLKQHLKLGFKSLLRHPLRSILTMLGIVFGVGAVVSMLAVGEGASYESQQRIKRLGSQNIIIKSIKPAVEDKKNSPTRGISSAIYGLTYKDAERIQSTISGIDVLIPVREVRQDIWNGPRKVDGMVKGTIPWYVKITGQRIKRGRFITQVDMAQNLPVCVITSALQNKLFPYEDPLNKTIKITGIFYRVIGVLETFAPAGQQNNTIFDNAFQVFIPLTIARERFGKTILKIKPGSFEAETVELHQILVKITDIDNVLSVSDVIHNLLKQYHSKEDFEMIVPLKMLEEIKRSARMFSIVLGMIAAISLLVGGIGIMNIMLANVTERTREIGIRRAIGAKKRDIVAQFLSETVVMSVVGGVLGLGVGVVLPLVITYFTEMKVIFTSWSLILSFSISAIVGLIFGIYPAYRAANMDPIEALRHS